MSEATEPVDQEEGDGRLLAKVDMNPFDRRIEIASAILLALATLASAWSAYQATRWGGVQATAFSEAATARAESVRQSNAAGTEAAIDVDLFSSWLAAESSGDERLADSLERAFRDEFKPAFETWLGMDPFNDPDAADVPFELDEYQIELLAGAAALEAEASASFEEAREANETSDSYVLTTVLAAGILFFAGIGTKFESRRVRLAVLATGGFLFLIDVALIATLPIH